MTNGKTLPAPSICSVADREREYSPSSAIGGNYQPYVAAYVSESAAAKMQTTANGAAWSVLPYGTKAEQTIQLCLPKRHDVGKQPLPLPLLVFIHGGYWQELSAVDSLFAASGCIENGVAFAAINYTLAPKASVLDIVQECIDALHHLHANALTLGINPQRIVLAGSSAGAHLAASVAQQCGNHGITLHGTVLVSGIYELEPLIGTSINDALGLTQHAAQAVSPALQSVTGFAPSVVCWGEYETDAFKQQSQSFAQQLGDASVVCTSFEISARNHFDVIMDLCNPQTVLGQATFKLIFGK